jgi:hypothetical protein
MMIAPFTILKPVPKNCRGIAQPSLDLIEAMRVVTEAASRSLDVASAPSCSLRASMHQWRDQRCSASIVCSASCNRLRLTNGSAPLAREGTNFAMSRMVPQTMRRTTFSSEGYLCDH